VRTPALRVAAGKLPTIEQTVLAMLHHHALDWSATHRRNVRLYLLSGRFPAWCKDSGIVTIDQLTTDQVTNFLAIQKDAAQPGNGHEVPPAPADARPLLHVSSRLVLRLPDLGDTWAPTQEGAEQSDRTGAGQRRCPPSDSDSPRSGGQWECLADLPVLRDHPTVLLQMAEEVRGARA